MIDGYCGLYRDILFVLAKRWSSFKAFLLNLGLTFFLIPGNVLVVFVFRVRLEQFESVRHRLSIINRTSHSHLESFGCSRTLWHILLLLKADNFSPYRSSTISSIIEGLICLRVPLVASTDHIISLDSLLGICWLDLSRFHVPLFRLVANYVTWCSIGLFHIIAVELGRLLIAWITRISDRLAWRNCILRRTIPLLSLLLIHSCSSRGS